MKKYFLVLISVLLFSCDDGDFDVPSFNFETATINACEDLLLFKINESESISIQLSGTGTTGQFFDETLVNQATSTSITYRIFNANVPTDYYCQSVPPSSPTITNEWVGTGTVVVNNVITTGTPNEFDATISIQNMVLTNSSGNEIRYDVYDFGVFSGTFN